MRIEFIYKDKNPAHIAARDFVRQFVRDRGLLATVEEHPADTQFTPLDATTEPLLIVDGLAYPLQLEESTQKLVKKKRHDFLAAILEEQLWCL